MILQVLEQASLGKAFMVVASLTLNDPASVLVLDGFGDAEFVKLE